MTTVYDDLLSDLRGLFDNDTDMIANAANAAAAMWQYLPDINWAGFYFMQGDTLVLGPFAGKPACVRIPLGQGVCGTAAASRETIVVPDVHEFPGHIACDSASNSEIVVPLIRNGVVIGVLDIDSPNLDRFQPDDRIGCEAVASLFIKALG